MRAPRRPRGREPGGSAAAFRDQALSCFRRSQQRRHSRMRLRSAIADLRRQARNPYSRWWLWIPGSLAVLAPRNDETGLRRKLTMATHKLLLLPGDGIGPEVMGEVKRLIDWLNSAGIAKFETDTGLVGGSAYDAHKVSISEGDMAKAKDADAIIFGAVGGPKWDAVPYEVRPEAGLLRLRKDLGLFANLRPAVCYPALAEASSLKREAVEGLDIMIVRELTGGVYFGEPKTITDLGNGQ